jgi:transposase
VVRVEAGVSPRVAGGRAAGGEGSMISLPAGVRVLVATRPVDFRKGADGLAALVREALAGSVLRHGLRVSRQTRRPRG